MQHCNAYKHPNITMETAGGYAPQPNFYIHIIYSTHNIWSIHHPLYGWNLSYSASYWWHTYACSLSMAYTILLYRNSRRIYMHLNQILIYSHEAYTIHGWNLIFTSYSASYWWHNYGCSISIAYYTSYCSRFATTATLHAFFYIHLNLTQILPHLTKWTGLSGVDSTSLWGAYPVVLVTHPLSVLPSVSMSHPWNEHQTPCKPCTKQDSWNQAWYHFTLFHNYTHDNSTGYVFTAWRLLVFAVMGVPLIFLFLVCKLIVASGTHSGLVFYPDILGAHHTIFPPGESTDAFSVFIARVNLEFGIETCFYEEMDPYGKHGCILCFRYKSGC